MTRDEFVNEMIGCAKEIWTRYWGALPDEQRLRLAGMEEELRGITRGVESGLWALVAARLDQLAIERVFILQSEYRDRVLAQGVGPELLAEPPRPETGPNAESEIPEKTPLPARR